MTHPANDFKQWGIRFDAELMKPGSRIAWRKLKDHGCDPQALKSILFYAARFLEKFLCSPKQQPCVVAIRADGITLMVTLL
jgi:hypothetical protein